MKDDPKLSAWERIPEEYKRQLYAFLAFDHYHAIKRAYETGDDRALLQDAVDWIGYALDEVEGVHDIKGESAALQWMEEKKDKALECYSVEHRLIAEGGTTYLQIAHGFNDTRGEVEFVWKGTSISGLQDIRTPDEKLEGGPLPNIRWLPWINWMGALYFFQNDVTIGGSPWLWHENMRFGGDLLITAMPKEDEDEIASLFAAKLTAPGAPGRDVYRPGKPSAEKKDGTSYPGTLVRKVGELVGDKAPQTVRDKLRRGGYVHPENLRGTKKPADQRPTRRSDKDEKGNSQGM